MAGEKTEKATPKRRDKERKEGNVLQSKEVVTVDSLIVVFFALQLILPFSIKQIQSCIKTIVSLMGTTQFITLPVLNKIFFEAIKTFLFSAMPILLLASFASIVATMVQTKGMFSAKALTPKFSKLNPIKGMQNLFSMSKFVDLLKSIIKIVVLTYIVTDKFIEYIPMFSKIFDLGIIQSMALVGDMIMDIVKSVVILFVFIAAADFGYQFYSYEKKIRMSKQDIKEEYKQDEGDPQIKGKIRQRQQSIAQRRMMQAVPTADVVIRNPTHFAVAIKYTPGVDVAPIVVAKGADSIALRIVAIAEENNIEITENRPLARGLYDAVELDQIIPAEFYQAIAELLAVIFSKREKKTN